MKEIPTIDYSDAQKAVSLIIQKVTELQKAVAIARRRLSR